MGFSRRHYRLVSPPADTPRDIRDRLIRNEAARLAGVDREREFPKVTADNVDAVLDYQEAQYIRHLQALMTIAERADEQDRAAGSVSRASSGKAIRPGVRRTVTSQHTERDSRDGQ